MKPSQSYGSTELKAQLDETSLARLAGVVQQVLGLQYPAVKWPELLRGLERTIAALQPPSPGELIRDLLAARFSKEVLDALSANLTTGETYFFRDPKCFEALEQVILPGIIAQRRARRRIRIWSAGCATGEEPYSIAILLARLLPDPQDWSLTILATDLDPVALSKAAAGEYTSWSFRGQDPLSLAPWIHRTGPRNFLLAEEIRRMVRLERLNLVEDPWALDEANLGDFDLILCRNVMMYFSQDTGTGLTARFSQALADPGWLVLGPSELYLAQGLPLESRRELGFICFRRAGEDLNRESAPRVAALPGPEPRPWTPPRGSFTPAELPLPGQVAFDIAPAPKPDLAPAPKPDPQPLPQAPSQTPINSSEIDDIRALADRGRLDEALAGCLALSTGSGRMDPELHLLQGNILMEMNQPDQALVCFRKGLYADPDMVMLHLAMAQACRATARQAQAATSRRTAIELLRRAAPDQPVPGSGGMTGENLLRHLSTNPQEE